MTASGTASVAGIASAAEVLVGAARDRLAVGRLTEDGRVLTLESAYEIQDEVVAARVVGGHPVVGYKLGLTSRAKQVQMKVDQPAYGTLTADMPIDLGEPLPTGRFIQPRCEPEIAFVLGRDLAGAHVGAAQVLGATDYVTAAVDVLDSRYTGYSFTLEDVVADNASAAGYVLGGVAMRPTDIDLRLTGCVLEHNGELVATAAGAAVLGHPAASVAWLVRRLATRGRGLRAGDVVLSGALTAAVAVSSGDCLVATLDRLGSIEIACR